MITVVLTIYTRGEYYKDALDSLASQSDQDFELLIYSNIPVVYQLSKFKDVQLIHPEKEEMPLWIADALGRAKNFKIAFLDDDDTFSENKVLYMNSTNFGYFHNDYNHITPGSHNLGNGFNMSCISINKQYFPNLSETLKYNPDVVLIDSFVYWYALENNVPVTISKEKLTNYRFRNYKDLNSNAVSNMQIQIEKLKMLRKYFKSEKVQRIIRQRLIQNALYLRSYGVPVNVNFLDVAWLMGQPQKNKVSLLATYFLTHPVFKGHGQMVIDAIRNKKVRA